MLRQVNRGQVTSRCLGLLSQSGTDDKPGPDATQRNSAATARPSRGPPSGAIWRLRGTCREAGVGALSSQQLRRPSHGSPFGERAWWLRRLAGDGDDEVGGDVGDLDVAGLGRMA